MGKLQDLSGKRFGLLVVIERSNENDSRGKPRWVCKCGCGNEAVVSGESLKSGNTKSCGCFRAQAPKIRAFDLTGLRFGRLVVAQKVEDGRWLCRCDCGNDTIVPTQSLRCGETQSCGCLHKEVVSQMAKTHGHSSARIYRIWRHIKYRCNNPNCRHYKDYGGRGISLCDEWQHDFQAFYDWAMDNGYDETAPKGQCTIDRIDNNGNYSPDNCRWADVVTQNNNRRSNKTITHNGETKTIAEWSRITGIPRATIVSRVQKKKPIE